MTHFGKPHPKALASELSQLGRQCRRKWHDFYKTDRAKILCILCRSLAKPMPELSH
jgi:hypothetical protein